MRRSSLLLAVSLFGFSLAVAARTLTIVPSTTVKNLTANNTSAADSFHSQSNGNTGAANVSKIDIHSLLYQGSRTRILAHFMPWFGDPRHMAVGYNSQDPAQVRRQINDIVSRGVDGVIIDWYGSQDFTNVTALRVMAEAEQHPGFKFAVMIDKGALMLSACKTCSPQEALIQQLHYVEETFMPSPAYLRVNGRPVITNFDIDKYFPSVNWKNVASAATSDPLFLFQDADGFGHIASGGSYSWVRPTRSNFGLGYMDEFYKVGLANPHLETVGAAYKGFNDTLASWGLNRIMKQDCGQTWLRTFAKINSLYSSTNQLDWLQLPTWNDYEEGTEIESGIDNCLSVAGSQAAGSIQWKVSGDESTVDHYNAFISKDGQNLMKLATLPVGARSLDVCSFNLANGKYVAYIQAVGKPTLQNQLSNPVAFSAQCFKAAVVSLGAKPSVLAMNSGNPVRTVVSVTPVSEAVLQPVALSCSNLPDAIECLFTPNVVTPGKKAAVANLTIQPRLTPIAEGRENHAIATIYAWIFPMFGLAGVVMAGSRVRLRRQVICVVATISVLAVAAGMSSCGGGPVRNQASIAGPGSGTYMVSIDADTGGHRASTTIVLSVHR